uniref:Uncharacterized protein n=1 Tax=Arundo donax TaxID=35708 RepID=A0A0A9AX45_ARUDO
MVAPWRCTHPSYGSSSGVFVHMLCYLLTCDARAVGLIFRC